MFKKIAYASLFILIFLLAVQSASASDVNLDDADFNNPVLEDSSSISYDENEMSSDTEIEGIEESPQQNSDGSDGDKDLNESIISADSISFDYASEGELEINLTDGNGYGLSNKTVSVKIDEIQENLTTDDDGKAIFKFSGDVGTYYLNISFDGDDEYAPSSASAQITIVKSSTKLKVPSVRSYMTHSTYIDITLVDSNGVGIANKNLTVIVSGKTYAVSTDSKGKTRVKIPTKIGNYPVSVEFAGDGNYLMSSASSKVVITKAPVSICAPTSININSNRYAKISITLKDIKGNLLKGKVLTITIQSNKKKYTVKTNSLGVTTFKFSGPKSNNLTIKFAGDDENYYSKSLKVKVNITPKKVKFKDVVAAADKLLKYISENKALPSNIIYKGNNFTTAELSYLMAVAITHANKKNYKDIVLVAVSAPKNSTGEIYDTVYKKKYVKIAKKAAGSSIKHITPSYIEHSIYKVPYEVYTAEFSRALHFYKSHKRLPKYVLFTNSEFVNPEENGKYTFYLTSDNIRGKKSELKMLKSLQKTLNSKGYNAVIVGIGPDIHNIAYRYGCTGKDSVLLAVFGGVDVGCIEEWTGELKNKERPFVKNYDGAHVLGLWFRKPYGASSSIHHRVGRAWDANYGRPLKNPAKYMSKHKISYIQAGKVTTACKLLKAGKMGGPKLIN